MHPVVELDELGVRHLGRVESEERAEVQRRSKCARSHDLHDLECLSMVSGSGTDLAVVRVLKERLSKRGVCGGARQTRGTYVRLSSDVADLGI